MSIYLNSHVHLFFGGDSNNISDNTQSYYGAVTLSAESDEVTIDVPTLGMSNSVDVYINSSGRSYDYGSFINQTYLYCDSDSGYCG